jgi:hypothetical protein
MPPGSYTCLGGAELHQRQATELLMLLDIEAAAGSRTSWCGSTQRLWGALRPARTTSHHIITCRLPAHHRHDTKHSPIQQALRCLHHPYLHPAHAWLRLGLLLLLVVVLQLLQCQLQHRVAQGCSKQQRVAELEEIDICSNEHITALHEQRLADGESRTADGRQNAWQVAGHV